MRAWFSARVGIVGIVMLLAYAPLVWFAIHLGVPPGAVVGSILVVLIAQYYLGTRRALNAVEKTKISATEPGEREVHELTEELAGRLNVPMPTLWVADLGSPNAFAVGRKGNGHIVLSTSLFQLLDGDELASVIAHELSHLRSRDVIPMVIGTGAARLVYYLFAAIEGLVHEVPKHNSASGRLAHAVMMCFVFAISREREYIADADARWAIGTGEPLADALSKIENAYEMGLAYEPPDDVEALCIAGHWALPALGSTHPSTTDRIDRLRDKQSS